MIALRSHILGRRFITGALLLIVLTISAQAPLTTSAALRACRADPVILLSNGETIQTDVKIETDVADVKQVVYTLHLPVGVKVIGVIYTPSMIMSKEVVRFINDMPPYQYLNDTVVTTITPNVRATAHTRALLRDSWASGMSGQSLLMRINPLL